MLRNTENFMKSKEILENTTRRRAFAARQAAAAEAASSPSGAPRCMLKS